MLLEKNMMLNFQFNIYFILKALIAHDWQKLKKYIPYMYPQQGTVEADGQKSFRYT